MHEPRIIAIGDIHGCSAALTGLLRAIKPQPGDTIITLGDYVDRGPDSRGVLDQLVALAQQCRLIPLLGNHDDTMLAARRNTVAFEHWMYDGGDTTLASYGQPATLDAIPEDHWRFLGECLLFHETDRRLFVHANYEPMLPMERQDRKHLLWLSLEDQAPGPHISGKTAIVGHTPQRGGKILDLGYLKCVDTGCGFGGLLTALDMNAGQVWQVDETGTLLNQLE